MAVLLPAETDERIWAYFATAGVPDELRVGKILAALAAVAPGLMRQRMEAARLRRALGEARRASPVDVVPPEAKPGVSYNVVGPKV